MKIPIESYARMGAWFTSHQFFYSSAYVEFDLYEQRLKKLREAEEASEKAHSTEGKYKKDLVRHDTADLQKPCMRAAYSALMFGCMSFEAFLNNYGVRRLGQAYFKRFVERMGITEKLAYLLCIGRTEILSTDDEIIDKCRGLFDARNALAHPKTKEVKIDDFGALPIPDNHPATFPIKKHFEDLEACIDALCQHDKDINRSWEFKK
ncbi:MAG: hypothetical protein J0L73_20960 [Verrucomicrobia bacterium]|nr:hypothetical protein [Verrucomicrobiota bacterium]